MTEVISILKNIAVILIYLAAVGFAGGVERETPSAADTANPDRPAQMMNWTYIQPQYEPLDNYINRIPDKQYESDTTAASSYEEVVPEAEINMIAQMMYGECRGDWIPTSEKAACAWVVCNRADAWDITITQVVTAPYQFSGYKSSNPVTDELYRLAEDVLTRWYQEKSGESDVGRVIPADYLWFTGNGKKNFFRNSYAKPYDIWDFSMESPYGD